MADHTETQFETMDVHIRASGIVRSGECDDAGCDDIGTYVPDYSKPRGTNGRPKVWVSFLEGLTKDQANIVRMNINSAMQEEITSEVLDYWQKGAA